MKAALMEYETLDSDQVSDLMERRPVRPPHDWRDMDMGGPSGGATPPEVPAAGSGAVGGPAGEH